MRILLALILFAPNFLFAQTPTVAAGNLQARNVYCQELELSWTNGNGSQRMVLARRNNSINSFPADNTFYFAKDSFGEGDRLGTDTYIIYRGTGNSMKVGGLQKNTTYYFAVIEFNGSGTNFQHLTSSYPEISVTTQNITANFSINDDYQCLNGNSFSFTNGSSHSGAGTLTYNWMFGDGNSSTDKDPTYSYTLGGVFQVSLRANTTGCVDVLVRNDTVVPVAGVKFGLRNDIDSIQCLAGNYYFFQNTTIPKSIGTNIDRTNYTWSFGDGATATGYNAFRSYVAGGEYTVKLITTRFVSNNPMAEGCSDSVSYIVSIKPGPVDPEMVVFSDTALCLYPNVFVFENRTPSSTINNWFFGDGDAATGSPVNKTYAAAGKYMVRLVSEDVIGCKDSFEREVEVFTQPNNSFTGLAARYCLNDPAVQLNPIIAGGTYYGLGVDPVSGLFTPSQIGPREIGYEVVIGNCRDTFRANTEVFPLPEFSLGNDTLICAGGALDVLIDVNADSYSWSDGNTQQQRQLTQAGTYRATAIKDGCRFEDDFDLEVIGAPLISLGMDTTICGGEDFVLNVTNPRASYLWEDGSTSATHRIEVSGQYWVVVENPCGIATDSVNVTVEAFSCDIFLPTAFSPNKDGLNDIFAPIGNFRMIQFKIFNRWGEVLYVSDGYEGWNGIDADGNSYIPGLYYYELVYQVPRNGNWTTNAQSGVVYVIY